MADEDKPFACSNRGCTLRFSNADHLEVHESKHKSKVGLQLPGKEQLFGGVDQTPTPTRFLENVERYGLFDVLKGDEVKQPNPFDMAFSNGAVTPVHPVQPFPVTNPVKNSAPTTTESELPDDVAATTTTTTTTLSVLDTSAEAVGVAGASGPGTGATTSSTASSLHGGESSPPQPTSEVVIPVVPLPRLLANPSNPVPVAPGPSRSVSMKLISGIGSTNGSIVDVKQQLKKNLVSQNPGLLDEALEISNIVGLSENQKAGPSKKRARTRSEDMDPDEKRRRFLERNRAAATRCREKRKTWITGLEKKAQEVTSQNQHLTQEISFLRNEVAQLKSLLLAHKDCPVTLQQQRHRMQQMQSNVNAISTATTTPPTSAPSQTLFLLANNLPQSTSAGAPVLINSSDPVSAVSAASATLPTISLQALTALAKSGQNSFILQQPQQQQQQQQSSPKQ